jgi:hypothetical protein
VPVPELILVVSNCSVLFSILYNTHMHVTFRYFGIEYALVMSIVSLYYVLQPFIHTVCVALYCYVLVQLYLCSVRDKLLARVWYTLSFFPGTYVVYCCMLNTV